MAVRLGQSMENNIEFILKGKGSIDPILLDASDTFIFKVIDYKTNEIIITETSASGDIALDLITPASGKITVTISATDAALLSFKLRPIEDGAMPKSRYYGVLDCDTNVLGKLRVHIPEIQVIPNGL